MEIYNVLHRRKETFRPIEKGRVRIYSCGPTVYWHQHVGNFRAYIFSDFLKRVLIYKGFKVKHAINITDVGHLTGDSDDGEDKMEVAAKREKRSAKEISEFYLKEFKKDFSKLRLLEPDYWPRATEHIKEQIEMIRVLEARGFTYRTSDGVYFDTSKFKDYGKLSNKKGESLEAGIRTSMRSKKHKTDFALWKFSSPQDKRQQEWESPWGIGFPGWHIECSAMATKYLGEHFDIHTGGEDHLHIHHENEIAQSEAALGRSPWVNYWMHCAFLVFEKEKMSKSSGKIITLSSLEEKGFSAMEYKFFIYSASYRKQLSWSDEAMKNSASSFRHLKNVIGKIKDDGEINEDYLKKFEERISDDLDTPGAIAVLWSLLRNKRARGKFRTIEKMDEVFALNLKKAEEEEVPAEVLKIAEERKAARDEKDFDRADELREKIRKLGYGISDEGSSYVIKKLEKSPSR